MYIALLVYASLYPFTNWRDQGIAPWSFLWAPMPRYWSGFDLVINLWGYLPLGALLVLLALRGATRGLPVLGAVLWASLLSLLMEGLQSYLPQRVASREDWLLNTLGAALGGLLALALARAGGLAWWDGWHRRWLAPQSRGILVLLLTWPAALLFPAAVPFGLGHVWDRLGESLEIALSALEPWAGEWFAHSPTLAPLGPISELLCVALGLLVPFLLGFCVVRSVRHRLLLVLAMLVFGFASTGLSAALSWGPTHTWAWLDSTAVMGAALALLMGVVLIAVPWRVSASLALLALGLQMGLLNQAPTGPYFAQTLQAWEQGRFIRFNGIAQWLGWVWPYAAMGVAMAHIARLSKDI